MRISWPTREVSNPRANERAHAHAVGPTYVLVRALGVVLRAIRLGEFSMVCVSVAIPTVWLRGGARCWGNCMRHSLDSSPGGDHALPLVALLVAQPLAPLVALLVGQAVALLVACWWWLVVGVEVVRDGTPCGGAVPVGFVVLWRCPTLPQPIGCSTIGAAGLSFQVRNGAGRFPGAVTTTRISVQHAPHLVVGCGLIVVCIVVAALCCLYCFTPHNMFGVFV